MGLDMYMSAVKDSDVNKVFIQDDDVETVYTIHEDTDFDLINQIGYWRKANAIHKYFYDEYIERGGFGDFNCEYLELNKEQLDHFKTALSNYLNKDKSQFEPMSGFFFGEQKIYDTDMMDALKYVKEALSYLDDGYRIFYHAWF